MLQKLIKKNLKRYYRIYKNFCRQRRIKHYIKQGQRPWSKGYFDFKWQSIKNGIGDDELLEKFKNNSKLPKSYGKNMDERIIEYPWFISKLSDESKLLLDAGSSLNFEEILDHKNLSNKKITIVTLNSESSCFWQKDVSYLFTDLRKLPFLDNYFDIITCISTLEHIGMDNTMIYTKDNKYQEDRKDDYLKTILELKRVLKPSGILFITVPFGKYQNLRFFQQFNQDMINQIIRIFNGQGSSINYYKYSNNGWDISNAEECKDAEYFNIHQTKYRNKNSNKDYDSDLAAAARAVACLKLLK